MARTVDPKKHEARRLHIIDAALTVIAERGYTGATTAAICRQAGIGSGTFFHYFPTKVSVLAGIIELGVAETGEFAAGLEGYGPLAALEAITARVVTDASDPRVGPFVLAVSAVMHDPQIAPLLAADATAQREVVQRWVVRAQRDGVVRTDLSAQRLSSWLLLLFDGFLERVATDPGFVVAVEGPMLVDTAHDLVRGGIRAPEQGGGRSS